YGSLRELAAEELARAMRLDPSQIAGLGPSLEALRAMLEERKRRILAAYETDHVRKTAAAEYRRAGAGLKPPRDLQKDFSRAFHQEQLRDLERLWYRSGGERSAFARQLLPLVERLGEKYPVDQLAARYTFTGRE